MTNLAKQLPSDTNYSERTQISLSPTLRRVIEIKRRLWGESLAEYIRKAVTLRILAEDTEDSERKRAVQVFLGSIQRQNHPEWQTPKKVIQWQRKIRFKPTKSK